MRRQFVKRKISFNTSPDIHIVQAGYISPEHCSPSPEHTVLLMPGALGTGWNDFLPQLEGLPVLLPADWSLVAWDPPGYGNSRPPQRTFPLDYFERDAEAVGDLIEALGCERYSVLGWSGCGIAAPVLMAQRPEQVVKLVVNGAPATLTHRQIEYIEYELVFSDNMFIVPILYYRNLAFTRTATRDLSQWPPSMLLPFEAIYGVEGTVRIWAGFVDGMAAILREKGGNICQDTLLNIRAASLIVQVEKDVMVSSVEIEDLRKSIPGVL